MGKAPAVIIIARHGARLDAEDASWAQSSPNPYDPPLSYGGWTQTRALGARIASILRERDIAISDEEISGRRRGSHYDGFGSASKTPSKQKPAAATKRRKRKVIIHSSPFLRCLQSSIAISAGMAQYEGNFMKFEAANDRIEARQARMSSQSQPARSLTLDSPAIDARRDDRSSRRKDGGSSQADGEEDETTPDLWKPTLRVDAFLGEWLSPAYFEFITAPPNSSMMVAGAKLDLMRRGSPLQGAREAEELVQTPESHWQSGLTKGITRKVSFKMDDIAESLSQMNGVDENGTDRKDYGMPNQTPRARHKSISHGYTPPVPTYAISGVKAIPPGFVAHARDACIRLDFQWDSMREPQNWGDGGEFGEEWRSMHKRMRRGLMQIISWYKREGPYYDPQAQDGANDKDTSSDDDEELVLVLVTHGAPCNALIGAITNQPVLLDVGMGSLTMAVHKGTNKASSSPNHRRPSASARRRSSVDGSQSDEYEMKFTASSDHLRAGNDPLKIPQLQSPYLSAIPEGRRNGGSSASSDGSMTPADLGNPSVRNAALGSMRRSRATTMGSNRTASGDSQRSSSGLWANRNATMAEPSETLPSRENSFSPDDGGRLANNAEVREVSSPAPTSLAAAAPAARSNTPQASGGGGLWGSGAQKKPPVRRWTVVEHN